MALRDRVLLPLLDRNAHGHEPTFDLGSLFLHLLLFEEVVVDSLALLDIAALARSFGVSQTTDLLNGAPVRIRASPDTLGASELDDLSLVQIRHLTAVDPEDVFGRYSQEFFKLEGNRASARKLTGATRARWLRPDPKDRWGVDAIASAMDDVVSDRPVFHRALERELGVRGHRVAIQPGQFHFALVDAANGVYRFEGIVDGVDGRTLSAAARKTCLALASLNGQIGRMKRDNAITGFSDDTLPFLESKFDSLHRFGETAPTPEQFRRVQEIAELPSFEVGIAEGTLDVDRFLTVRKTDECKEFRHYLATSDELDDVEIKKQLLGLRAKAGTLAGGVAGRIVRMLVTAVVGAKMPGVEASLALSAADAFLLQRILPKSGAAAFVGAQYPSMFYE